MHLLKNKAVLSLLATFFVFLGCAVAVVSNEQVAPATVIAQTGFGKGIDEPVVVEQPARKKFAVIIGITYDNNELGEVSYASQDAFSMYELLTGKFGFPRENVILLRNGEANRRNILDALGKLVDSPDIDEESDVVVFYSGHGLRTAPDAGLNLPGAPEAYALVPFDFMNFDYKKGQGLIWDGELASYLEKIHAGRMWINIDSCFAGGFNRPGITGDNRIVTMSSRSNELSSEMPEAQRGVMMEYMVEQGVARGLTIEQAYAQAVPLATQKYGQNPLIADNYPGNMDLGISPRSPNN